MRLFAAFLCIGTMFAPLAAHAGPVESPGELRVNPMDNEQMVLRWDYAGGGLLYSDDGGQRWELLCNSAIDPTLTREGQPVVMAADGTVFLGTFGGMWRGAPGGCDWSRVDTFEGQWVSDLTLDPQEPTTIYAITSKGDEDNSVFAWSTTQRTWTPIGTAEPFLLSRLIAAPLDGGGVRLYQSLSKGEAEQTLAGETEPRLLPDYYVRYSDDRGETWTERAFEPTLGSLRLLAVDHNKPERIAVGILFGPRDPRDDLVFLSESAGEADSWVQVATPSAVAGADFGPDGELYIADRDGDLLKLPAGQTVPSTLIAATTARCVEYVPSLDTLYLCKIWEFGSVDRESGQFTNTMNMMTAESFLDCGSERDVVAMCEGQMLGGWCGPGHYPQSPVCSAYAEPEPDVVTTPPPANTATAGMGTEADEPETDVMDSPGAMAPRRGCAVLGPGLGGNQTPYSWALLGATALLLQRRRRRTR